jgi:hypothetical protein
VGPAAIVVFAFLVVIPGGNLLHGLQPDCLHVCYTLKVATDSSSVLWRYGVTG